MWSYISSWSYCQICTNSCSLRDRPEKLKKVSKIQNSRANRLRSVVVKTCRADCYLMIFEFSAFFLRGLGLLQDSETIFPIGNCVLSYSISETIAVLRESRIDRKYLTQWSSKEKYLWMCMRRLNRSNVKMSKNLKFLWEMKEIFKCDAYRFWPWPLKIAFGFEIWVSSRPFNFWQSAWYRLKYQAIGSPQNEIWRQN